MFLKQTAQVIDLRDLAKLTIDEVVTTFQPRWENILIMAIYPGKQTLIITTSGDSLLLKQPLKELLATFARENVIYQHRMQTLYHRVGCNTRGYIAGHQRLVPACGVGNSRVAYYMVHRLDHAAALPQDGGVVLVMKGEQQTFHILIDVCHRRFRTILDASDEVAEIQLAMEEYHQHQYGKIKTTERTYDTDYCVVQKRKRLCHEVYQEEVLTLVENAMKEQYSEVDYNLLNQIKRQLNGY